MDKQKIAITVAVSFLMLCGTGCYQTTDQNAQQQVPVAETEATTLEVSVTQSNAEVEISTKAQGGTETNGGSEQSTVYGLNNPAPIGVAQVVEDKGLSASYTAEIKCVGVKRGQEALDLIMAENSLNEPPEEGYEYILARFSFTNVKCEEGKSVTVNPLEFTAFSAEGSEYDVMSSIGVVVPDELQGDLYQGATKEGYVLFATKIGDSPKVSYGTKYDGTGGIWFKLN